MSFTYGNTLLTIDDVTLAYGDRTILRGVSAEIKDIISDTEVHGQVIGFLGPSGIGKTSLFRIIAGLERPTSGKVTLGDGKSVTPGDIGVVAQSYPLFAHRSVYSNLMVSAKMKHGAQAKGKVDYYLNYFSLNEAKSLYPAQLSGGQRQRVAITQQLLCSEHFILMDEPFSGLDLIMLEKTCELIRKVADADSLNTLVLISHDITTVCAVSDTVWMMGRDRDAAGNIIPGARIVQTLDLFKMGLKWEPGITTNSTFVDYVRRIKTGFRSL